MIDTDDFLEHFGVKGMKWGVRKKNTPGVTKSGKPSTDGKETNRIMEKAKTQGIRSLTNHELRVINSRTTLETTFTKQNPPPPTLASHGKKFAKEIFTAAGIGSAAGIYKLATSDKGKSVMSKGMQMVKSSPFLKIGVKTLPRDEQLKLF